MIGTIRKHSKWVWLVIIAVTVVTFVFWGSQNTGSSGRGPVNFGSIEGEPITQEDYVNARREAYLRWFFNNGEWPGRDLKSQGFNEQRETYYRLLLLKKLRDLNIHVSEEAAARAADQILRSLNRGKPVPLEAFEKQILATSPVSPPLTADDFRRFIQHDLGIQELIAMAGLGGKLATPQDLRALYAREHEELQAEAVFFLASNYLGSVTATPESIAQYYTNHLAAYRVPERMQVSYVAFEVSNNLAKAEEELGQTNLDNLVEANYNQLGTNLFPDAKTPEAAKARIREELIKRRALADVRVQANDFATKLQLMQPMRAENLETLARSNGLTVKVSAPFDEQKGPKDLEVGPDFAAKAFRLKADDPLGDVEPLVGLNAVYVIAFNKLLPAEIPPLEKVRDQITEDYKYSEAVQLARRTGQEFFNTLTNSLARGKDFDQACAEAKVHPLTLPPFSLSTQRLPEVETNVSLGEFKNAAFSVAYGRPNQFVSTPDGGFVVVVHARLPLNETKLQADFPAFASYVRQTRQNEAFNRWFVEQINRDPDLVRILRELESRDRMGPGAAN